MLNTFSSECNDPQKVLSRLCVPSIRQLDPEIVIIYLQSIIKVYGSWSLELASDWDDRWLSALKKTVNSILDGILPFTSSTDVEVQERVSLLLPLTFSGAKLPFSGHKCDTDFQIHQC